MSTPAPSTDTPSESALVVELVAWRAGAQTIEAIKRIREYTGLDLKQAKQAVDDVFDGKATLLTPVSAAAAHDLTKALNALHFDARLR